MSFGRFLGVGVSDSGDARPAHLDHAVPDVTALIDVLGDALESEVLRNPAESTIRRRLKKLPGSMSGGPLVVLWCGHAVSSAADSLRLLARNSASDSSAGIGISDLMAARAESGANQLLVLVDTCFSGAAAKAGEVAAAIMQSRPPEGKYVWVGMLTSCLDVETARDGLFGQRLRKLLIDGPRTPELRVRWSPHSQYVRGDDVCDAVLKEWDSDVQSPDFSGRGSAWWVFPNPLYDAGAPEQVVEHLLQAARGGAGIYERSWFTGRTTEVDRVVGWVRSRQPGIYVITGSAGTGKSAIAGRVVSLSNPEERARLLGDGHVWEHQDPGIRSVQAHVHARGLTADRAAAVIADQLVAAEVLEPQREPRNASELVGQVQRAVEQGKAPAVVVVDGLDEARAEAFPIAEDLLARLVPHAVVVVSTRELNRGDDQPSLIGVLSPGGPGLDLDDPAAQHRTRGDVADYIAARLAARDPRMDGQAVADYLATEASMTADRPFLLARLVADQLRASPVDTSQEGWEDQVSRSIEDAFDADLAGVGSPPYRQIGPERDGAWLARPLLAALTWGYGGGFPEEEWLAVANALSPDAGFGRDDVLWLLGQLGRYILQDGEAGVAVYRVAHQSLADHLRRPFRPGPGQLFDPQAGAVTESLAARYRALLAGGIPVTDPAYLWRCLWRHAADAGLPGLAMLRNLAVVSRSLQPDVAMAALQIADLLKHWGRRQDAVAPTEEAADLYRGLAGDNPAFLPDLATALSDLGIRYSEVGRRQDAITPTEEAVQLRRGLARDNRAYLLDLAIALANLGSRYGEVGRVHDAVDLTEEAVQIYRDQARDNPAYLPGLAGVLVNLGVDLREVGRRHDAVDLTEEAVRIYRDQARDNPAYLPGLAGALDNLGVRYSEVGHAQDAIVPVEEAVQIYRDQARDNPAYLPDLAMALSNLGNRYGLVGRVQDAIAPAEEAAQIYRDQARDNRAYLPALAMALTNLGVRYRGVGHAQDAIGPTEEAVQLRREQAADNRAYLPNLAGALNNLGLCYNEIGSPERSEATWEQALSGVSPAGAAFLLTARAAAADAGHPEASRWLIASLRHAPDDRELDATIHQQVRRHWSADPVAFSSAWARATGKQPPAWLAVDARLLAAGEEWIATETYADERDFLASHLELLDPAADGAVSEALLSVSEDAADRYTMLRQAARTEGVEAAYRPLLLTLLAREFAFADLAGQRGLLATRREDLLDDMVAATLDDLASQSDESAAAAAERARALLVLAGSADAEQVLDALAEPDRFPGLLHSLAARDDPAALLPAAVVAYTAATTATSAATAIFYLAAGTAIAGDQDQARGFMTQARDLCPGQVTDWVNQLAELGQHHPAALPLIPALTALAGQATADSREEAADATD